MYVGLNCNSDRCNIIPSLGNLKRLLQCKCKLRRWLTDIIILQLARVYCPNIIDIALLDARTHAALLTLDFFFVFKNIIMHTVQTSTMHHLIVKTLYT